jgi:Poly(ADP-ribose) polymerase and DNA-Ligase Zn-finger region
MRVGSLVDFKGNTSFSWRHWGCTTPKIIANMKKMFEEPSELDGYEELGPEDQKKVDKAWEDGQVADEDIPESARKPLKNGGETDDEVVKEKAKKNKKTPAARKKVEKDAAPEPEVEDEDEKPKKKRAPPKKKAPAEKVKAPAKKKAPKKKKQVCNLTNLCSLQLDNSNL